MPWYSLAMTATVVDMILGMKVFLGRFDMRTMQFALSNARSILYDITNTQNANKQTIYHSERTPIFSHLENEKDLWIDFVADVGDGFNSR